MMNYTHFTEGDRVWVVDERTQERLTDGVVQRITDSGQIVLEDGRRFTFRGEGWGDDRGTLVFPAGRYDKLFENVRDRITALGGLEALSVVQLEKISRTLGIK